MAGFGGWAVGVLHAIGAPVTPQNLRALLAWQRAEGGGARFNPLNTTQGARGATNYNSVGVKNFTSEQQGIQATAKTLLNGHYGNIVGLLRSGQSTAEQVATAVAHSPWGTGSGVLRVLGSGPVDLPHSAAPQPHPGVPAPGNNMAAMRQALAGYLLQSSQNLLSGQQNGPDGLLQLALMRKQLQAAQQANGPMQRPTATPTGGGGHGVQFLGDVSGVKSHFLASLSAAVAAAGGTKVRVTSGVRSPAHNAAVGGVAHSNHLTGDAVDGEVFIPGKGWVPLGTALRGVAGRFGLRSGDVPGFYHGGPDTVHVDDGFNQH